MSEITRVRDEQYFRDLAEAIRKGYCTPIDLTTEDKDRLATMRQEIGGEVGKPLVVESIAGVMTISGGEVGSTYDVKLAVTEDGIAIVYTVVTEYRQNSVKPTTLVVLPGDIDTARKIVEATENHPHEMPTTGEMASVCDRLSKRLKPHLTAAERAAELMEMKGFELPPLAREFRDLMFSRHAACAEIAVTFEIYAQLEEGLEGQYDATNADYMAFAALQLEKAADKLTDKEPKEDLFAFLQGNVPEGWEIKASHMPKLSADQAESVMWYLEGDHGVQLVRESPA